MDNDWETTSFAPFLTALHGGVDLLGLTSITGDTWEPQCALHAVATLEVGNLSCIPVYEGALWPLLNTVERAEAWQIVHGAITFLGALRPENITAEAEGADPTGGNPYRINKAAFYEGFPSGRPKTSTNAVNFMIETVSKYPGCVSIYTAGPLTNVALAVRSDPKFASLAKEIVIMGGMLDRSLVRAIGTLFDAQIFSDTNFLIDPEAAKITLNADFSKITLVGDVTSQVIATQEFADEVFEVKNAYTELFYNHFNKGYPLWDETAAAVFADPSVSTNQTTVYVDVDTAYGSPTYGNLRVYREELAPPNSREATYILDVDTERVLQMIKLGVQYPKSCASLSFGN
ncbi:hypothetical protein OIDMADRAFT_37985 [Oidiodendron maius Zn]|uniref:Inosine/uridine-preferring nucleoside hydrolase domain-containing protein n=1 Tax=Oidiodendron maius (strain Zn) TaxID=913774 RepID=A0A0C3I452_OIDMZ|nr:hypothetical protein OIDMADRAFT_37985 [Oidiodendron maius Zn]